MTPLSVLMIASEAAPFAKTGGLADVASALPAALARLGHDVTLVVPRYRGVDADGPAIPIEIPIADGCPGAQAIEQAVGERQRVVFVDCPRFYDRDALYGIGNDDYADNARRFAFLARAALEAARRRGARPSIVHGHDWQAGLAPVYLARRYAADPILGGVPSVFTIHNMAFQGLFPAAELPALDLDPDLLGPDALEHWGRISFLKGGINFSDTITTVSRRYAKEILTPEFGFGFEGILARRKPDLVGIPNGIDTDRWDPARDPYLPAPFSADDLAPKIRSKIELLRAMRLPSEPADLERPVVGMVSRLVDQKGFDLLLPIADDLLALDAVFTVVGTGERQYEDFWTTLAARRPDRVAAYIGFNERLAHLVEAGADMFLMPSRFEPSGLNQMYSLRYGTVPIVRATGGLDDTVKNYNARTGTGTGFKFKEYGPRAVLRALRRALAVYRRKGEWRALQIAGMRQDHSWDVSAREYVKVYRRLVRRRRVTRNESRHQTP